MNWNPYYLEYCRMHGNTPEQQLDADTIHWPGGKMAGFILWNRARWSEFAKLKGIPLDDPSLVPHRQEFGEWLKSLPKGHGLPV